MCKSVPFHRRVPNSKLTYGYLTGFWYRGKTSAAYETIPFLMSLAVYYMQCPYVYGTSVPPLVDNYN